MPFSAGSKGLSITGTAANNVSAGDYTLANWSRVSCTVACKVVWLDDSVWCQSVHQSIRYAFCALHKCCKHTWLISSRLAMLSPMSFYPEHKNTQGKVYEARGLGTWKPLPGVSNIYQGDWIFDHFPSTWRKISWHSCGTMQSIPPHLSWAFPGRSHWYHNAPLNFPMSLSSIPISHVELFKISFFDEFDARFRGITVVRWPPVL